MKENKKVWIQKKRSLISISFTVNLVCVLLFVFCSEVFCKDSTHMKKEPELYNQNVFYDGILEGKMKIVVMDLLWHLNKMTKKKFKEVYTIPTEGIILSYVTSKNIPVGFAKRLNGKGKEAFLINSDASGRLWIVGNSDIAVRHGIYFYLDQLGCRWFFPNEHWTITPSLKSIGLQINLVEAPAFRLRTFAGTGGFGGHLPVDPNMENKKRWKKWMERNRLGGDIKCAGHIGKGFNMKYMVELEANPEWLAEVKGKRKWSKRTRLCVSNPDLQNFFVADRLAAFKRVYDANPDSPKAQAISVDPTDGGIPCQCEKCRKLGSNSDRVFTLANITAKPMAELYPDRYVNLYAYAEHAGVPNIPLEPNLYVFVIPNGFQRTGLSGDDLLRAWAKKHHLLGVYDYWGITGWSMGMPKLDFLKKVPEKIHLWNTLGVNAFVGQSDYGAGNVGISQYLTSKLLWDPKMDDNTILNDFYKKSFGVAVSPMKRMLERWAKSFTLSHHELGLSFQDISEARHLAQNPIIKARVDDYAKYLQYIRLRYEYLRSAPKSDDRKQKVRDMLTYIWRIYDSAMIHSYFLSYIIMKRNQKSGDDTLLDEFPIKNSSAAVWTNLKPVTSKELDKLVDEGMQTYKPFNFKPREFLKNLRPISKSIQLDGKMVESLTFVRTHHFQFWMPKKFPQIEIFVRVNKRLKKDGDRITVKNPKKEVVIQRTIPSDGEWHALTIQNHGEGVYFMDVYDQAKLYFTLKIPSNLPFVVVDYLKSPRIAKPIYFYVPKGLNRIAMHCRRIPTPIKLFDSNGLNVPYKGDSIIIADVPEGQDGKIWSISKFKSWFPLRPLNFPVAFSFTKQGLMIPDELKSEFSIDSLGNKKHKNWEKK